MLRMTLPQITINILQSARRLNALVQDIIAIPTLHSEAAIAYLNFAIVELTKVRDYLIERTASDDDDDDPAPQVA